MIAEMNAVLRVDLGGEGTMHQAEMIAKMNAVLPVVLAVDPGGKRLSSKQRDDRRDERSPNSGPWGEYGGKGLKDTMLQAEMITEMNEVLTMGCGGYLYVRTKADF